METDYEKKSNIHLNKIMVDLQNKHETKKMEIVALYDQIDVKYKDLLTYESEYRKIETILNKRMNGE